MEAADSELTAHDPLCRGGLCRAKAHATCMGQVARSPEQTPYARTKGDYPWTLTFTALLFSAFGSVTDRMPSLTTASILS